jgi:hypothetical protein
VSKLESNILGWKAVFSQQMEPKQTALPLPEKGSKEKQG